MKLENAKLLYWQVGPDVKHSGPVAVAKLKSLGKSTTRRHPLNRLYKEFLRLVKEIHPPFFVMENVGRMFSMSNGIIKKEIEEELAGEYLVQFYYENAVNFGVPQSRKRGVVIGNRIGVSNPILRHTHYGPEEKNDDSKKKFESVRSAISDLPHIKAGHGAKTMAYPKVETLSEYQKERRKDSLVVSDHVARKHNERDLEIFSLLQRGEWINDLPNKLNPYRKDIFMDKYKKQRWDLPASTILAHLSKDGLMFIHPDKRQNRSFYSP